MQTLEERVSDLEAAAKLMMGMLKDAKDSLQLQTKLNDSLMNDINKLRADIRKLEKYKLGLSVLHVAGKDID